MENDQVRRRRLEGNLLEGELRWGRGYRAEHEDASGRRHRWELQVSVRGVLQLERNPFALLQRSALGRPFALACFDAAILLRLGEHEELRA